MFIPRQKAFSSTRQHFHRDPQGSSDQVLQSFHFFYPHCHGHKRGIAFQGLILGTERIKYSENLLMMNSVNETVWFPFCFAILSTRANYFCHAWWQFSLHAWLMAYLIKTYVEEFWGKLASKCWKDCRTPLEPSAAFPPKLWVFFVVLCSNESWLRKFPQSQIKMWI